MVRDLFRKTGRPAGAGARARSRSTACASTGSRTAPSLVLPAGRGPRSSRRSRRSAPGLGPALGRLRRRRTPTTGRCCAGATSRPWDPDAPSPASSRRGSTPRDAAQAAARGRSATSGCGWSRRTPSSADGHDLAQRARLGRAHGVPRAAVRRVDGRRRDGGARRGAGPTGWRPAGSTVAAGAAVARHRACATAGRSAVATDGRRARRRRRRRARSTRGGCPRSRRTSSARCRRSRRSSCHLGLDGDVRDLPHEVVRARRPDCWCVRTGGRAPDGGAAWTVPGRGQARGGHPGGAGAARARRPRRRWSPASTAPRATWSSSGAARRSACCGRAAARVRRRLGPRTPVDGRVRRRGARHPRLGAAVRRPVAALVAQVVGPA